MILAHVRAASVGSSVAEANTHPFCARGKAFMHNGEIGRFRLARRRLLPALTDEAFEITEGSTARSCSSRSPWSTCTGTGARAT